MTAPRLSVVIPAHDEERSIGTMLDSMLTGSNGEFEVVVVANGCRDDTAGVVRRAHPEVTVVEIDEASKIAALDAGDDAATVFPRAYVDADVDVDAATLRELAAALETDEPRIASPSLALDLHSASALVRAYYSIWELSAFRSSGHIGSGIYAMSRAGRARFGRFPRIIGDDRFVQGLFAPSERITLDDHAFVIRPPRTIRALVHRGGRIAAGNQQLRSLDLAGEAPSTGASFSHLVRRVATKPWLWPAFVVYCVVQLRTRRLAKRKLEGEHATVWDRDETSRA